MRATVHAQISHVLLAKRPCKVFKALSSDTNPRLQSPSLFDQTVRDADEEFYATFPEAKHALARSTAVFSDNSAASLSYCQDLQEFSWMDTVSPIFFLFQQSD